MMYELTVLLRPDYNVCEHASFMDAIGAACVVTSEEVSKAKRLAYPINGETMGVYAVYDVFITNPLLPDILHDMCDHNKDCLRFLLKEKRTDV